MKEAKYFSLVLILILLSVTLSFGQSPPPPPPAPELCSPNWQCTSWSNCVSDTQTRTCTDSNDCGDDTGKPAESQSCTSGSTSGSTSSGSSGGSSSSSGGSSGGVIFTSNHTNTSQQQTTTQAPSSQTTTQQETTQQTQTTSQQQESSSVTTTVSNALKKTSSNTTLYLSLGALGIIVIGASIFLFLKMKKPKVSFQPNVDPAILQLRNYIKDNLNKGYTREQIAATLMQSGYSQQTIGEAMKYV